VLRSLTPRDRWLLSLLALGSLPAAFVNTVFTQTVAYSAEEFGIDNTGQGLGAAVVRWGIFLALPFVALADRHGRRRMIVLLAWLAPTISALGALAPSFPVLVATQTVGRPLGIMLEALIAVVAIEELPRGSRAFGTAVLAVASGIGAGVAVAALPFADVGTSSWRIVYVVALLWLVVAWVLTRRLPETGRFAARAALPRVIGRMDGRRLFDVAAVAFLTNIFIASASIFQNRYLKDEREFSATMVAVFTTFTTAPSAVGLVLGGRVADVRGRRLLAALAVPAGAVLLACSFTVGGPAMWLLAISGGILLALAYPAVSVYRGEMFPTRRRGLAGGLITTAALIGGSVGLVAAGRMIDSSLGFGASMLILTAGPLLGSLVVWRTFPETASRELEEINPDDVVPLPR